MPRSHNRIPPEQYVAPGVFHRWIKINREQIMDKEHIKGAADQAKGAVKDAAGKVTNDPKLQAEGKLDKAKGAAHNAVGDAKDALKEAKKP
jgi:uncharacterized protein YjbJ (UPF0337 family)